MFDIKKILLASCAVLVSSGALAEMQSSTIDGLYNTGAGFEAGAVDTHYTFERIEGTATGTDGHGVTAAGKGFPFNTWLQNSVASTWLTPAASAARSYDPKADGLYKWSLSFDLTGFDSATASFAGRWAADNNGYIQLNGSTIETGSKFNGWTSFSALSGFGAGVNTLDFFVTNYGWAGSNPTGLRVEFLSSSVSAMPPAPHLPAAVLAVPEPSPSVMILAGLVVVGAVARRRIG